MTEFPPGPSSAEAHGSPTTRPTTSPTTSSVAEERFARLAAATARLRGRSALVAERWLLTAGAVLVPLGAVVVLLGWYGTAHTTRVWQQVPYLMSGGLLGLGLMVVGGLGYFAAWLARLVDESRRQTKELVAATERAVAALERLEARTAAAAAPAVMESGSSAVPLEPAARRNGGRTSRRAGRSGGRATV